MLTAHIEHEPSESFNLMNELTTPAVRMLVKRILPGIVPLRHSTCTLLYVYSEIIARETIASFLQTGELRTPLSAAALKRTGNRLQLWLTARRLICLGSA